MSYLRDLADLLGHEQPFYALCPESQRSGSAPASRVEHLAADYVRQIRHIQPAGPYLLGGFSFGGIVAFQMAQQLTAEGDEVGLLALIDTHCPVKADEVPAPPRLAAATYRLAAAIERHLLEIGSRGFSEYLRECAFYWREGLMRRLARIGTAIAGRPMFADWDLPAAVRNVIEASLHAERSYVPRRYPGRVVMFLGSEWPIGRPDTRLAWAHVASEGLEVHLVPGDHMTMRDSEHMRVLAAKLGARMKATR